MARECVPLRPLSPSFASSDAFPVPTNEDFSLQALHCISAIAHLPLSLRLVLFTEVTGRALLVTSFRAIGFHR
jgi:hypothetical protein